MNEKVLVGTWEWDNDMYIWNVVYVDVSGCLQVMCSCVWMLVCVCVLVICACVCVCVLVISVYVCVCLWYLCVCACVYLLLGGCKCACVFQAKSNNSLSKLIASFIDGVTIVREIEKSTMSLWEQKQKIDRAKKARKGLSETFSGISKACIDLQKVDQRFKTNDTKKRVAS